MKRHLIFIFIFLLGFFLVPNVYATDGIKIKNISVADTGGSIVVDPITFENNTVTSKITFNKLNDLVVFDVELENTSNKNLVIKSLDNNINNEYISIKTTDVGEVVEEHSTKKIKVTLKYENEMLDHENIVLSTASIGVRYNTSNLLTNPKTGRSMLLLLFVITLVFVTVFSMKKKKKILLLLLLLSPTFVFAADDSVELIKFNNIEIKKIDVQMGLNPEYFFMTADESMDVLVEILREWGRTEEEIQEYHIAEREGYTEGEILERYLEDFYYVAYGDMYEYYYDYIESSNLTDEEMDIIEYKFENIRNKWDNTMNYLMEIARNRGNEGLQDPQVRKTANQMAVGIYEFFDEIGMLDKQYGASFIDSYMGSDLIDYGKTKTATGNDINPEQRYYVNGYGDVLETIPNPHTYRMHFVRIA